MFRTHTVHHHLVWIDLTWSHFDVAPFRPPCRRLSSRQRCQLSWLKMDEVPPFLFIYLFKFFFSFLYPKKLKCFDNVASSKELPEVFVRTKDDCGAHCKEKGIPSHTTPTPTLVYAGIIFDLLSRPRMNHSLPPFLSLSLCVSLVKIIESQTTNQNTANKVRQSLCVSVCLLDYWGQSVVIQFLTHSAGFWVCVCFFSIFSSPESSDSVDGRAYKIRLAVFQSSETDVVSWTWIKSLNV